MSSPRNKGVNSSPQDIRRTPPTPDEIVVSASSPPWGTHSQATEANKIKSNNSAQTQAYQEEEEELLVSHQHKELNNTGKEVSQIEPFPEEDTDFADFEIIQTPVENRTPSAALKEAGAVDKGKEKNRDLELDLPGLEDEEFFELGAQSDEENTLDKGHELDFESDTVFIPRDTHEEYKGFTIINSAICGWPKTENRLKWFTKQLIQHSGAAITAAPTAIQSLRLIKPSDQLLIQWWATLSNVQKGLSVGMASCSFIVNYELFIVYANNLLNRLKRVYENLKDPKEIVAAGLSILLGLTGAIPAAVIAYESFVWLPYAVYLFTGAAFSIYGISRTVGTAETFERLFSREIINLQKDVVEKIRLLTPAGRNALDETLQHTLAELSLEPNEKLTEEKFQIIFREMAIALYNLIEAHPDDLGDYLNEDDKSILEKTLGYAGTAFDSAAFAVTWAAAFITFAQKGATGAALLGIPAEETLGTVSSLASANLYAITAMNMRTLTYDAIKYASRHTKDIPWLMFKFSINAVAATSPYNVASKVLGEDNIYHIPNHLWIYHPFTAINAFGGFAVNFVGTLKECEERITASQVNLENLAEHYHNPAVRTIRRKEAARIKNRESSSQAHRFFTHQSLNTSVDDLTSRETSGIDAGTPRPSHAGLSQRES